MTTEEAGSLNITTFATQKEGEAQWRTKFQDDFGEFIGNRLEAMPQIDTGIDEFIKRGDFSSDAFDRIEHRIAEVEEAHYKQGFKDGIRLCKTLFFDCEYW